VDQVDGSWVVGRGSGVVCFGLCVLSCGLWVVGLTRSWEILAGELSNFRLRKDDCRGGLEGGRRCTKFHEIGRSRKRGKDRRRVPCQGGVKAENRTSEGIGER
jgi:hypothetical protein